MAIKLDGANDTGRISYTDGAIDALDRLTVFVHCRIDKIVSNARILDKGANLAGGQRDWMLYCGFSGNALGFEASRYSSFGAAGFQNPDTGRWVRITASMDVPRMASTLLAATCYYDGREAARYSSSAPSGSLSSAATSALNLGNRDPAAGAARKINGAFAEMAVWARVLSPAEHEFIGRGGHPLDLPDALRLYSELTTVEDRNDNLASRFGLSSRSPAAAWRTYPDGLSTVPSPPTRRPWRTPRTHGLRLPIRGADWPRSRWGGDAPPEPSTLTASPASATATAVDAALVPGAVTLSGSPVAALAAVVAGALALGTATLVAEPAGAAAVAADATVRSDEPLDWPGSVVQLSAPSITAPVDHSSVDDITALVIAHAGYVNTTAPITLARTDITLGRADLLLTATDG